MWSREIEDARIAKANRAQRRGEMIPCPVCGKVFPPFTKYDGQTTGVYCCMSCANSALKERREQEKLDEKANQIKPVKDRESARQTGKTEKPKERLKTKIIKKSCWMCGKAFTLEGPDHGNKYCSWQCQKKAKYAREKARKERAEGL